METIYVSADNAGNELCSRISAEAIRENTESEQSSAAVWEVQVRELERVRSNG
ncbi:MAG: hypothetical protein PUF65_06030 [Lachnospiraceae bacterium]|nr:hypothetical protein [Lachnospiraceae bacterium]